MLKKLFLFLAFSSVFFSFMSFAQTGNDSKNNFITFIAQSRIENSDGHLEEIEKTTSWNPKETAVIVVDMWDKHWCNGATARVAELAPAINQFVTIARSKGMLIIHAPSDTMNFYQDQPARLRAKNATKTSPVPNGIESWRNKNDSETLVTFPIDDTDGGCDTSYKMKGRVWKREIDTIKINENKDFISDSGVEIWNVLNSRSIKNVILVGVHTNFCILGRPFGLRNLSRFGKNTVRVRDLTDAMYNPAMAPHVNHFAGVRLVVEYIEKYISPTTTSTFLTGNPEFKFKDEKINEK